MDHRWHTKFKCTSLHSQGKEIRAERKCAQSHSVSMMIGVGCFDFIHQIGYLSAPSHLTKPYNLGPQEEIKRLYSQRAYSNVTFRKNTHTHKQKASHLSCFTVKQSSQRLLFLRFSPCWAGLSTSLTVNVFVY